MTKIPFPPPISVEWDESKNQANIQKHRISFVTAALVFADNDRIDIMMRFTV